MCVYMVYMYRYVCTVMCAIVWVWRLWGKCCNHWATLWASAYDWVQARVSLMPLLPFLMGWSPGIPVYKYNLEAHAIGTDLPHLLLRLQSLSLYCLLAGSPSSDTWCCVLCFAWWILCLQPAFHLAQICWCLSLSPCHLSHFTSFSPLVSRGPGLVKYLKMTLDFWSSRLPFNSWITSVLHQAWFMWS